MKRKEDSIRASMLRGVWRRRNWLAFLATLAVTAAAYLGAFLVRFGFDWPHQFDQTALITLPLLLAARGIADTSVRLHLQQWRYVSTRDMLEVLVVTAASSLAFAAGVALWPLDPEVPLSVIVLEFVFASYAMGAIRLGYRLIFERLYSRSDEDLSTRSNVLVVGAGEAGNLVAKEIQRYPEYGYDLVGFVDDDPGKVDKRIRGVTVLGTTNEIPDLVDDLGVDTLLLAMPSVGSDAVRRIVDVSRETGAEVLVLPPADEVRRGQVRLHQLRQARIEDLLAREPIQLEAPRLKQDFRGTVGLITGAAGSIGSELARQVSRYDCDRLVALDQAESDLYLLQRELARDGAGPDVVPVVADIVHGPSLQDTIETHRPDWVLHAAAYKHVPLLESNSTEAIRNNVLGTWRVIRASARAGVERFVLVSTDKAVRPSNVMGATKRVAELIVQGAARRWDELDCTAVRFGNVLGSQGSVIPLFRRQIAEGKPITVTHPDATRYFMTIPEAAHLVLQASTLPVVDGQVLMLEMGDPVRILDLAKNMLRLAGVEGDLSEHIDIIGLRPGEKLHEELRWPDEEVVDTGVSKIKLLRGDDWSLSERVLDRMKDWQEALGSGRGDGIAREVLELAQGAEQGAEPVPRRDTAHGAEATSSQA